MSDLRRLITRLDDIEARIRNLEADECIKKLADALDVTDLDDEDGLIWFEDDELFKGRVIMLDGQIFLPASAGWPSTTNGCADPTQVEFGTNDIDIYLADFDPDSDEYMQFGFVMPSDYDGGTITAQFYWTADSGSSDDVVWGLQAVALGDGISLDQAWGAEKQVVDTHEGTANYMDQTDLTDAITIAGTPAPSKYVQIRVRRDADSGSDTLSADARLIGIMISFDRAWV
ncbi:hypothetical protein GF373_17825 [bacterium]|nr:hypothetical protein [bacterium]